MSLPNQSCPDALILQTADSLRLGLCGKRTGFWPVQIIIPVNGQSYQQVQGKVVAYQYGRPDAFRRYGRGLSGVNNIDGAYVDGISITHGQSPRKHIWTYTIGQRGGGDLCPSAGGIQPPGFVGENYFCSAGNPATHCGSRKYTLYPTPLWSNIFRNCEDNDPYFGMNLSVLPRLFWRSGPPCLPQGKA